MDNSLGIKNTPLGWLIYGAMAAYLAAFVALIVAWARRENREGSSAVWWIGMGFFVVAFGVATAGLVLRWVQVARAPMRNLFEVFLCMGVVMLPIALLCRYALRVGGMAIDALIGVIVLFPAGFVERFGEEAHPLPPSLQTALFAPHVAAYVFAYVICTKAAVMAFGQVFRLTPAEGIVDYERATYRMVRFGFPVLTLGLILGCWWAKICNGDWWAWDPKELWSLVSWLFFVGYLHFRHAFGRRYATINSVWVIYGLLAIIVTLLWANLSELFEGWHSYA